MVKTKIILYAVFETRDGDRQGLGAFVDYTQANDLIRKRNKLYPKAKHDIQQYSLPKNQWHG